MNTGKPHILAEIRRTAATNDGRPLGFRQFARETGIRYADWFGIHWKSWGDAVKEAGFAPNTLRGRISDDDLLTRFVFFARELGRMPVKGDLRLKKRADPSFPNDKVFERRFGTKDQLVTRLRQFCASRSDCADLMPLFAAVGRATQDQEPRTIRASAEDGFVYLLRSGRFYKLGRTNAFGRRERELAIQLPQKANTVHTIKTDDPQGIEAYWHERFAAKRRHGEWFELTAQDVAAFKRRKFM